MNIRIVVRELARGEGADQISAAVPHVGNKERISRKAGSGQGRSHSRKRRLGDGTLKNGEVGAVDRVRINALYGKGGRLIFFNQLRIGACEVRNKGIRRDLSGEPAAGGAPHPVANHGKCSAGIDAAKAVNILIFFTYKTNVAFCVCLHSRSLSYGLVAFSSASCERRS